VAVIGPDTDQILLDPSMFLGDEGFGWLLEVPLAERHRFVVSGTFYDQLALRAPYTPADEELWGPFPQDQERGTLAELVYTLTIFREDDAAPNLPPTVLQVAGQMRELGSQVAVEEWLYLQTNSWLAARTRKILDHFQRAGSRSVELAGQALDAATWRVLQLPQGVPGSLTPELRRAAGIRVVVAAGVAVATALQPWVGVAAVVIALIAVPPVPPIGTLEPGG
jgi:hypothetical protein